MNDLPRQTLSKIVHKYGVSLCDDPRRCEGLLRDLCGEHRREIYVLVTALEEGVAADLLGSQDNIPQEVLLARLTKRLIDELALAEDAALWAVESWALALGVISNKDLNRDYARKKEPKTTRETRPKKVEEITREQREMRITLSSGVHMIFVKIKEGIFLMGSDKHVDEMALSNENPQHEVYLDEYWIGKYPVTNRQYKIFDDISGRHSPFHWGWGGKIPEGIEDHPVRYITWNDAVAFCKWSSDLSGHKIRLPSEAEWEKAARGTDGRIWPWGNQEPNGRLCNYGKYGDGNSSSVETTPVGAYSPAGDSPYGCADMAGNVWEWVADRYDRDYYETSPIENPQGPSRKKKRVLRGGSWLNREMLVRCATRRNNNPDDRKDRIGFRCACDLFT